jgi:copper transport protein
MGLQGADVAGLGLSHALSIRSALDTLDTSYGEAAVARLLLLAVLAALAATATASVVRVLRRQVATLSAAAATLLTLTLAGHARTGRWVALALPLDLVHLAAAATWIGGLAILTFVVLPQDHDGDTAPLVARFSRIAAVAVGAVVATGVVQAYRQLGSLEGLRTTNYGRLLVIKTVAVAVVVVFGALSRSLVRSQVDAEVLVTPSGGPVEQGGFDDEPAPQDPAELRRSLRRSVAAEALVAVVVLAVTSLLVSSDPARTIESQGFSGAKVVQGTVIQAVVAPTRTGPVTIHIYASDTSVGLTTQFTESATLSLPDKGIAAVQVPLQRAGRTHFSAYGVDIPIRGTWRLDVVVVIGQFDERRTSFTVKID